MVEQSPNQQPDPDLDALNADLDNLASSFPEAPPASPDVTPGPEANAVPDPEVAAENPASPAPSAEPEAATAEPAGPEENTPAPEASRPTTNHAAAVGAAAVGANVANPQGGEHRSRWDRLFGETIGRRSKRAQEHRAPDTTPADPDVNASAADPAEPAAEPSNNTKPGGPFGSVVRRSKRAQQHAAQNAANPATPDENTPAPETPGNPNRASNSNSEENNQGSPVGRRSRRAKSRDGRKASPAPTDPDNESATPDPDNNPAQPTPTPRPATPPANPNTPTPAAPTPSRSEKARSVLTPAGMASWIAVKSLMLTGNIKDRLQLEQENPNTMKWINIGAAALVGARIAYGAYASYKGYGTGQVNTEAMQMVAENTQTNSQAGSFTDAAIDQAAPRMDLVSLERPIDETGEASTNLPPVDPSDLAPMPVELGEWGGKDNPSKGTIWGATMDYLQDMGYDTDKLTDTQKYNLVDEVLQQNDLTWDEATRLNSDFQVELPSANAMEDLMDKHEIAHGELNPMAEVPETETDSGTGTGSDSPDGSDLQNGEQPGSTPTPTPAEPAPSTSAAPTPTPSTSATPSTHQAHEASGNWDAVGDEALKTLWQSAALFAINELGGASALIAEEKKSKNASARSRNRTSRRASGRRPGGSSRS